MHVGEKRFYTVYYHIDGFCRGCGEAAIGFFSDFLRWVILDCYPEYPLSEAACSMINRSSTDEGSKIEDFQNKWKYFYENHEEIVIGLDCRRYNVDD